MSKRDNAYFEQLSQEAVLPDANQNRFKYISIMDMPADFLRNAQSSRIIEEYTRRNQDKTDPIYKIKKDGKEHRLHDYVYGRDEHHQEKQNIGIAIKMTEYQEKIQRPPKV